MPMSRSSASFLDRVYPLWLVQGCAVEREAPLMRSHSAVELEHGALGGQLDDSHLVAVTSWTKARTDRQRRSGQG